MGRKPSKEITRDGVETGRGPSAWGALRGLRRPDRGAGVALQQRDWGATIPELVPREQLRAASRLDLVGLTLSRAVGPALAGLVIAYLGGVHVVFALNAISVVFLGIVLLYWCRPRPGAEIPRERFVPALRAGVRYVWQEPVVRRVLLRAILFMVPPMARWGSVRSPAPCCSDAPAPTNVTLAVGGGLYAATLATVVVVPGFPPLSRPSSSPGWPGWP